MQSRAGELGQGEWEQNKLEAVVARASAVVSAQEVKNSVVMHIYSFGSYFYVKTTQENHNCRLNITQLYLDRWGKLLTKVTRPGMQELNVIV